MQKKEVGIKRRGRKKERDGVGELREKEKENEKSQRLRKYNKNPFECKDAMKDRQERD